jgi:hypothetical protein
LLNIGFRCVGTKDDDEDPADSADFTDARECSNWRILNK